MASRRSRRDVRYNNYHKLSDLRVQLLQFPTLYLSQNDLKTLGIEWSALEASSEDRVDIEPRFCKPCSPDLVDRAFDKAFEDGTPEWAIYDPEFHDTFNSGLRLGHVLLQYLGCKTYDWDMMTSTRWDRVGRTTRNLSFQGGYYSCSANQWRVIEIFHARANAQPHLACLLIDGAKANKQLRRTELICAVTLMMQGIKLDQLDEHFVNPVFVYSISDREARILQVHYDGSRLVVRTTTYLNFEQENQETLKQFLSWMLSEPIGSTKFNLDKGPVGCSDAALVSLIKPSKTRIST